MSLAALIRDNCDAICDRFVAGLYASTAPPSLDREAVLDSLKEYLQGLGELLAKDRDGEPPVPPSNPVAQEHGRQRFALGYDLGALVREYGRLRDILIDFAESHGVKPTVREYKVLSKYLIGGIADSVNEYTIERDKEARELTARHLGFLAHELRNPLSSMRLAFQLMRARGEIKQTRLSEMMDAAMGRLGRLIDGALLQMRFELGTIDAEPIELRPFIEEIAAESAAELEGKNLDLRLDVPEAKFRGDRKLLQSAISNLLRNAIKFTPEGGKVEVRGKSNEHHVVIEVEDSCGGLPEGKIAKLFDPFVQAGRDRSGFGLGLAIAKQVAEAHHGDLRVHDLPGKGCVFVLDLPDGKSEPAKQ